MGKENLKKTFDELGQTANKAGKGFVGKIGGCIERCIVKMNNEDSNFRTRTVSGIVMLLIAIMAISFFKGLFFLLVVAVTILMTYEWIDLTKSAPIADKKKWSLIGFLYILLPMFAVLKLHDIDSNIVLWMFAIICSTDIFAYVAGKNFGGPKLMPTVSPNKTWAGLAGGVTASMIIGFLSSFMFTGGAIFFIFISLILSLVEQGSDLMESKFKRTFGVKDSGSMIPGHGGILDRLDGMVLVAPLTLLIVLIYPANFGL